jgi:hypothetical protein
VRLSAAVAAGRAGDYAQVREHLGAARALAIQQQRATQALQAGLLLLALPDWDPVTRAAMADELARMPAVAGGWECLEMRLTYVLTGLAGNPCPGVELPRTASLRGLAQLLDAGVAWQAGAADTARIHLAAAAAQGAERGLLGPWMWWMAARLGVPTQAGPPDLRLQPVLVTQAVLWWNPGAAGRLDPASQGRVPAGTAPR